MTSCGGCEVVVEVLVITTLPIISTTYYLVSTRILGISNSLMQTEDSAQAARLCSSHSVGKDVFAQPGLVSCLNVAACNVCPATALAAVALSIQRLFVLIGLTTMFGSFLGFGLRTGRKTRQPLPIEARFCIASVLGACGKASDRVPGFACAAVPFVKLQPKEHHAETSQLGW